MKPEDQRIASLEYLGWTDLNRDSKLGNYRALRGTSPDGKKDQIAPNPLKDLNIIHEAERVLIEKSETNHGPDYWVMYMDRLNTIICDHFDEPKNADIETLWEMIHAGTQHRLEAFLKTVDRWKE